MFKVFIVIFALFCNHVLTAQQDTTDVTEIYGILTDSETGTFLENATVQLITLNISVTTDIKGHFVFYNIPPGNYTLKINKEGYEETTADKTLKPGDTLKISISPLSYTISDIIVTPGQFSVYGNLSKQTYTRTELEKTPHLGEDIYRAITRLPGISSGDFSAKFNIRGGQNDEVLVLFDGLELYEPFHMKEVNGGTLSIIDIASIENLTLLTGGFTSQYGNRLSGVFDVKSKIIPQNTKKLSLGLSLLNAYASTEGALKDNNGGWYISARRGYIDFVLKLIGEDEENFSPSYYDFFAKFYYRAGKHLISLNTLYSKDILDFTEDDNDNTDNDYSNLYSWLNIKSEFSRKLNSSIVLFAGKISQDRNGTGYFDRQKILVEFQINDKRNTNVFGLTHNFSYAFSDFAELKLGYDIRSLKTSYDYFSLHNQRVFVTDTTFNIESDTIRTNISPKGYRLGTYSAFKFSLFKIFAAELGLRYDKNSYTNEELFSPRINAAINLGKRTNIRAGWGYFYQPEEPYQIHVEDGEKNLYGAQLSKHYVIGIEHNFNSSLLIRAEAYYKDISSLKPAFINASTSIEMFPEVQDDRIKINYQSAVSKGFELYAKGTIGKNFTAWLTYSLSERKDFVKNYILDDVEYSLNREIPGFFDQRHTFNIDLSYSLPGNWSAGLAWQYHSGWPYTDRILVKEALQNGTVYYTKPGEPNSSNYPAFHRLDIRINKMFRFKSGQIDIYVDIINAYNHDNVRGYNYDLVPDNTGSYTLEKTPLHWLPILPSLGVKWILNF